jgi:hypothetical protein
MMERPELGSKVTCLGCHERFYKLNRAPTYVRNAVFSKRRRNQACSGLRAALLAQDRNRRGRRQPSPSIDEVEPVGTIEIEVEDDVPESNEEADDDIEIDPGSAKPAD